VNITLQPLVLISFLIVPLLSQLPYECQLPKYFRLACFAKEPNPTDAKMGFNQLRTLPI
jgi:hypothetical protein